MVFYRYFKLYLLFQYLQNCSVILIATEISRACSSKTAKHLFDENFRRQLLMDGQYGNIVFVCTKNDVLTPTELIRYFNNKFLYGSLSYYFVNLNLRVFFKLESLYFTDNTTNKQNNTPVQCMYVFCSIFFLHTK